jgi:hypothetical protein
MLAGKDWKDFQSCLKQPALPGEAPQKKSSKKILKNKKSQMNQKS